MTKPAKSIDIRATGVDGTVAIVEFNTSNWTESGSRLSANQYAMDIMQLVSNASELEAVTIVETRAFLPLIDEFGNSNDRVVMRHRLSRGVIEKIVWENMSHDKFESLVSRQGTLFIHRALQ